jgi:hypothetical protein
MARRMPPQVERAAKRLLAEGQNALARASSALFQSLARDAKRVPAIVKEEASKLEGMLDAFIGEIASDSADAAAEEPTSRQTPRAKKRKRKAKR